MNIVRYSYPTYRSLAALPGGFGRSTWSGLESEIDRLFDTALGDARTAPFPVEVNEDNDNTVVRAELPGVNREAITIELADSQLTISASRKTPASVSTTATPTEGQAEQSAKTSRSVWLSREVQADKVSATYENGLLTVTLPKAEALKPRQITIN